MPVSSSELEDLARAEATQQILAKRAKLGVAQEAILTKDLAELAVADRAKVKQLEAKVLGSRAAKQGAEDVGDIIVCDDYNVNRPSGMSKTAVGIGATLAGAAAAAGIWWATREPAKPSPATKTQEWYEVREKQQPDGSWKETGRVKLRRKPDGSIEEVK
ncbi:MAG: hypothetical protein ACRDHG_08715 [Anaerolineales bacterium]